MSFVTTATEQVGCKARHRAINNDVLPDPTGPPIPTRKGEESGRKETHLPFSMIDRPELN
jgi:hypothetical protein